MREVRDSARHAEIVEGRSGPVSDLCWRYLGVVKADENEAGHRHPRGSGIAVCSKRIISLKDEYLSDSVNTCTRSSQLSAAAYLLGLSNNIFTSKRCLPLIDPRYKSDVSFAQ